MLRYVAFVLLLGFIAVLFLPGLSPVSLSYVSTDSMEPTISEGDGYILVKTSDIEVGDIITYRFNSSTASKVSKNKVGKELTFEGKLRLTESGGYITHRVVGRTDEGYITKGDNNPSTDQAAGFPPVQKSDIVGEVLTVGGNPVIIPGLGTYVEFVSDNRGTAVAALAVIILLFSATDFLGGRNGRPGREVVYVRDIVLPIFVAVVMISAAFAFLSVQSEEVTYVVVNNNEGLPSALEVGENTTRNVTTKVNRLPFTTALVEAQEIDIVRKNETRLTPSKSRYNLTVFIPARPRIGTYTAYVNIHTYPSVLPRNVLSILHGVEPLVAWSVSVGLILLPLYLVYLLFLDGASPLRAPRIRWIRRMLGGG